MQSEGCSQPCAPSFLPHPPVCHAAASSFQNKRHPFQICPHSPYVSHFSQHTIPCRTTQSWTTTKKQMQKNGISTSRASRKVRSTATTQASRLPLQEALMPLRNRVRNPGHRQNGPYSKISLPTNLHIVRDVQRRMTVARHIRSSLRGW